MLVPLSLIKQWVHLNQPHTEVANKLTLSGLEVDAILPCSGNFSGVIAAKVKKTEPHPGSDKLQLVTLDTGSTDVTVICGDLNCKEGMHVCFAGEGAKLKLRSKKPITMATSTIKGVSSPGMLASEAELDLSEDSSGICLLDETIIPGTDLATLTEDTVFEVALTPNLGHLTSVRGVARHCASLFGLPMKKLAEAADLKTSSKPLTITEKESACGFSLIQIDGVKVGKSPFWLRLALARAGMRSINSIVDVTNFIMLTLGQPLHAYDKDKLPTADLDVQVTRNIEAFHGLDDGKYTLQPETMVIKSGSETVAIAGVMGSYNSQVDEKTTSIILEAGYFNGGKVRFGSKTCGIRTESSGRFEKGIDPEMRVIAQTQAAKMIMELSGGSVSAWKQFESEKTGSRTVNLRLERLNNLLGTNLVSGDVEAIFKELFFPCKTHEGGTVFSVQVPSYRNDLHEEVDLIEEVAIIYGYENIKKKHRRISLSPIADCKAFQLEEKVRSIALKLGLQEMLTCSLISPEMAQIDAHRSSKEALEPIRVLKPGSVDQSTLRPSMLPGMLEALKHNLDHNITDVQGFEVGKIHFKTDAGEQERLTLGIVMMGSSAPFFFGDTSRKLDFFDLKGAVETVTSNLATDISFEKEAMENFHPNNQVSIFLGENERIGIFGQLHPRLSEGFSIKKDVFYAEIDLERLMQVTGQENVAASVPAQFPSSSRDWTLHVSNKLRFEQLNQVLKAFSSTILEKSQLLDVYEGEKLAQGQKNVTLRFTYRSKKQTLTQETVDTEHENLMQFTRNKLGDLLLN